MQAFLEEPFFLMRKSLFAVLTSARLDPATRESFWPALLSALLTLG